MFSSWLLAVVGRFGHRWQQSSHHPVELELCPQCWQCLSCPLFWCWFPVVRSFVAGWCSDCSRRKIPRLSVRILGGGVRYPDVSYVSCGFCWRSGMIWPELVWLGKVARWSSWIKMAVEGVRKRVCWVFWSKCNQCFCRKSMPRIFSLNSSVINMLCVHFFFYENVYLALFIDFQSFAKSCFEWINVDASNRRPSISNPVEIFLVNCTRDFRFILSP